MKSRGKCIPILDGKFELCKNDNEKSILRLRISKNDIPSKNCENRAQRSGMGMQQGKINAPTFAYRTVYGQDPPQFLRGRTNSPKKLWKGLYVDEGLKDEWLEELNALPIDIRSSEEGKDELRPAFVMFRMPPQLDDLNDDMVKNLKKHSDLLIGSNIGQGGRPRICVANKITKSDVGWEDWWSNLPSKINSAYENTLESNGLQVTFDDDDDLERKVTDLLKECSEKKLC